VTDHQTTLLGERLHRLADDMTPQLDVVAQVRTARAGHRRRRRIRWGALAVATAAAAAIVGTTTAADLLSVDRGTEVAVPGVPTTTSPEPTPAPPTGEPASNGLPVGWEPRSFQGVTFGVPPGARMADTVDQRPVTSWMEGPSLTWHGPAVGAEEHFVKVMITETFEGGLGPGDGGDWFDVPGAEQAYGGIEPSSLDEGTGGQVESTILWLDVLHGDRLVRVNARFAAGPEGETMANQLIDSLSVASPGGDTEQGRADAEAARQRAEQPEQERLAALAAELRTALEARESVLSLTAPADLGACPEDTGAMSAALGVDLIYRDSGLPGDAGECEWTTAAPSGGLADHLSVGIGFTPGWTEEDVSRGVLLDEGCYRSAVPATPIAFVDVCPLEGQSTQWMVFVADAGGAGAWTFLAVAGQNQPVRGSAAIAAVLDVADATW
jgi:hypothetical protein